jgi:hypothetical protein
MKLLILFTMLLTGFMSQAQTPDSIDKANINDVIAVNAQRLEVNRIALVSALKDIRKTALWHLRFRKAHDIQQVINQYEYHPPTVVENLEEKGVSLYGLVLYWLGSLFGKYEIQ